MLSRIARGELQGCLTTVIIAEVFYKRRWDEQWKVGNRWQCGPVAYDAELIEAFSWWLAEKAEWWLEQQQQAVSFDEWVTALWQDRRVQAAWPVVAAAQQRAVRRVPKG